MEKVGVIIIGAGVVGLAIAERLSKRFDDVVLVEQESSFGQHTSSRNSEVLHSGIYYPENSLKAKMCVRGLELIYPYLEEENVPYNKCGKFIIASSEDEVSQIKALKKQGEINGVKGLELVDSEYIQSVEADISAHMGVWVPSCGIVDVHNLMRSLEFRTERSGVLISYSTRVAGIKKTPYNYVVTFEDGYEMETAWVINSAGLFSDEVAEMVGLNADKHNYRLHYCKGEYFKARTNPSVKHLVYPVPHADGRSLGIHTRLHLDGGLGFGPNAYYVDSLNYKVDNTHKQEFYDCINTFYKIDYEDLNPDDSGIRPKLQVEGGSFRDFVIQEESSKGYEKMVNLIGIESPGITSCLAIAEYVDQLLN